MIANAILAFTLESFLQNGMAWIHAHPILAGVIISACVVVLLVVAGPAGLSAGSLLADALYGGLAIGVGFVICCGIGNIGSGPGGPGVKRTVNSQDARVESIRITQDAPRRLSVDILKGDNSDSSTAKRTWYKNNLAQEVKHLCRKMRDADQENVRVKFVKVLSQARSKIIEEFRVHGVKVEVDNKP
jgi:hypothetical protein